MVKLHICSRLRSNSVLCMLFVLTFLGVCFKQYLCLIVKLRIEAESFSST